MLPGAWVVVVVVVMQQGRGQRVAVVVGQWESMLEQGRGRDCRVPPSWELTADSQSNNGTRFS